MTHLIEVKEVSKTPIAQLKIPSTICLNSALID